MPDLEPVISIRFYELPIDQAALVSPDLLTQSVPNPNDQYYGNQWGFNSLSVQKAWGFTKGAGIIVAVIDVGAQITHPDLAGNIWHNPGELSNNGLDDDLNGYVDDYEGWDFRNGDKDVYDPSGGTTGDSAHGTHVAGIIGALADNNEGIAGIAPESDLMILKGFNSNDTYYSLTAFNTVISAIYYAANMGARVINMSLAFVDIYFTSAQLQTFSNAVLYAKNKGAIVVAAAGNNAAAINGYPALLSNVITVGALKESPFGMGPIRDSSYSNFGSQLDFMAPGTGILSLKQPGTYSAFNGDADYTVLSGTSMAAPHVAGAIALMLANDPTLSFEDVYRRLKYSAVDLGSSAYDDLNGYGMIDPFRAISEDYYSNGIIKSKVLLDPDAYNAIRYSYDWLGRPVRRDRADNTYTVFEDYYSNRNAALFQRDFDAAGNVVATRRYTQDGEEIGSDAVLDFYPSGILRRYTNPATGSVEEYLEDNYFGNWQGRIAYKSYPGDIHFDYQYMGLDYPDERTGFRNGAAYVTDKFFSNGLLRSRSFGSGAQKWFYDNGNVWKAMTDSTTAQSSHIVEYEYMNEDFFGDRTGRIRKVTYQDGTYDAYMQYWNNSSKPRLITRYAASGKSLTTFEFDTDGVLVHNSGASVVNIGSVVGKISSQGRPTVLKDGGVIWNNYDQGTSRIRIYDPSSSTTTLIHESSGSVQTLQTSASGKAAWYVSYPYAIYLYDGGSTRKITDISYLPQSLTLGSGGHLAWIDDISSSASDPSHLYSYNGSAVVLLATSVTEWPANDIAVNSSGNVVWTLSYGSGDLRAFIYNGTSVKQLSASGKIVGEIRLSDNGHAVWEQSAPGAYSSDIYLYNGVSTIVVAGSSADEVYPTINSTGVIAWQAYDGQDYEIYVRANGVTTRVTNNAFDDSKPIIADNGTVTWFANNDIYTNASGAVQRLTNDAFVESPVFSPNNQNFAWVGSDGQVRLYDGTGVRKFSYLESAGQYLSINDNGQVVWAGELGNVYVGEYEPFVGHAPDLCVAEQCEYYANGRLMREIFDDGLTEERLDENYYQNNTGRTRKRTAADGSYKLFEEYYFDTDIFKIQKSYDSNGILLSEKEHESTGALLLSREYYSDGVLKILELAHPDSNNIIRYEHFQSGFLESAELADGSVYKFYEISHRLNSILDTQGNLVEYQDDTFGSGGAGRLARVKLATGLEYFFMFYWGDTNTVQTLGIYQDDQLVSSQNFYSSGALESIGYPDGSFYELYETSQKIKSVLDASGNVLEFYDDAFGSGGNGRNKRVLLPDGTEYRFVSYWNNTNTNKTTEYYFSGDKIWSRTYFASGGLESQTDGPFGNITTFYEASQNRKSTLDAPNGITYEHRDENWQGTHIGRYSKITDPDGSYQVRTEYWGDETPQTADDTDHVHWASFYNSSGVLQTTIEFDPSGNPLNQAAQNQSGEQAFQISDTMTSRLEMHDELLAERKILSGDRPSANDKSPAENEAVGLSKR